MDYDEACRLWAASKIAPISMGDVKTVEFELEHRFYSMETGCDYDLVAHVSTFEGDHMNLNGLDFGETVQELFAISTGTTWVKPAPPLPTFSVGHCWVCDHPITSDDGYVWINGLLTHDECAQPG